ncbi:hypothetical protein C8024_03275 [Sphingopyxis sp. BSNA05]|nr:hypothetical protein [Sphingopyxis sp. BSNA05]
MAAYIAQDEGSSDTLKDLDKAREIVFSSVALDAILTAHPDSTLRQKPMMLMVVGYKDWDLLLPL